MSISSILKRNKLVYEYYHRLFNKSYRLGYKSYKLGNYKKSKIEVDSEVLFLKNHWKCYPVTYFVYRLFEKDLTRDELLEYVPSYYWYNIHIPKVCENINMTFFDDKIEVEHYFSKLNIQRPIAVAIIRNKIIYDSENKLIDFDILCQSLLIRGVSIFFVKPSRGCGGKGIFTIEARNNKLLIKEEELSSSSFINNLGQGNYIIQEGIIQREDMSLINPSSVNTIRAVTRRYDGKVQLEYAVLRMGRKNSFLDNASKGGISIGVDVSTGILNNEAVRFPESGYTEYDYFKKHPDTGFLFRGYQISGWITIKNEIEESASKISDINEIGWDIAITKQGISVVEINVLHGIDLLEVNCGGVKTRMGIEC